MRARFHVRGSRVGFYRESSHDLCDAATSGQLQPGAIEAVRAIVQLLARDETTDEVQAVELAENIAADARAVHLELRDERTATRLATGVEIQGLTGLSWSLPSDSRTRVVMGIPYVMDSLDIRPLEGRSIQVRRHVRAFFQGNRYLLSELVQRVLALVPDGPVTDLYAGVGLFAVSLASTRRDDVVAVEGDAISALDLTANAASCERPFSSHHVTVEEFCRRARGMPSHTVIIDPPRTGLSRDAMMGLTSCRPRRIVYVSCDIATLARDVKNLVQGGYRFGEIEAFDLFPNTPHVETIAVLDRM
jgi:23S rRNA (uracil1939-C5)-methyltransferase